MKKFRVLSGFQFIRGGSILRVATDDVIEFTTEEALAFQDLLELADAKRGTKSTAAKVVVDELPVETASAMSNRLERQAAQTVEDSIALRGDRSTQ